MDFDREDGEIHDENEMDVEEEQIQDIKPLVLSDDCTVLFKADKSGPIVKKVNKVDASKLEERAKRFGLNLSGNRIVTQQQIDELYANIGIEGNERHFRLDTIHLTGIDGLNTKDVFEYLEEYKPVSLEWVDATSCNVVCQDHIAAALALLVHTQEIDDGNLKKMLSEKSSYHWREAMPHTKKDVILMRFATNADKKLSRDKKMHLEKKILELNDKNPWGDLCMSWGVYDHQEIFQSKIPAFEGSNDNKLGPRNVIKPKKSNLALRLGKRSQMQKADESSDSDSEWNKKSKIPRMRMRADDEESRIKKKVSAESNNISDKEQYTHLSIEFINSKNPSRTQCSSKVFSDPRKQNNHQNSSKGILSRLGNKVLNEDKPLSDSDDESNYSDDNNYNTRSKVQKVENNLRTTSVWSRLDKPGLASEHNDLREMIKKKHEVNVKAEDLRDRLSKAKSNLRIEIDNNYAK
ncbi:unnamed protein product [Leptosia nina]|uniref:Nuclear cap-binding protein subunit 3 n=1 Tax=Leptosia nina TaxID=320188 RepID=A0AAV1JA15_9NEOP